MRYVGPLTLFLLAAVLCPAQQPKSATLSQANATAWETGLGGSPAYTPAEAEWDREYEQQTNGLAEIGRRTQALVSKKRTKAEDAELKSLKAKLTRAEGKFQDFLERLLEKSKQLNVSSNRLERVGNTESIQDSLNVLPPGTVAVYTLAAPDAFRLIFVSPTVTRAHTVTIKEDDLNKMVATFRAAIQVHTTDPKVSGKALYDCLVKPIEDDLKGAGAKTIMWSLDGALRYIPLSALWDGQQYLIERFNQAIFNPSAAERLERDPKPNWKALAAGVSEGRTVAADDGPDRVFGPLYDVRGELDAVVATFPGSKELLGPSFTVENFENELLNHPTLVHLATHFAFNTADETKSFLLTGSGPVLSIGQLRTMPAISFQGVSLLTLSACETGLGGTYGDGSEVEGISVIFQKKGAEAVISSLWPVADEPTRLLMTRFYANRKAQPDWTKLECLRQAQLALLEGREHGVATEPGGNPPFSQPYFWAPFVLSGNWK